MIKRQEVEGAKPKNRPRMAVWFDQARDIVCVLDTADPKYLALKEGDEVPRECIFTLSMRDIGDLLSATLTMVSLRTGMDAAQIMDAILQILDGESRRWAQSAEQLRAEIRAKSGGVPTVKLQRISVDLEEYNRLKKLEENMCHD